jgi:hypothetical protein
VALPEAGAGHEFNQNFTAVGANQRGQLLPLLQNLTLAIPSIPPCHRTRFLTNLPTA